MEPFRYHVFICNQIKPEGVAGCAAQGAAEVIDALNHEIASAGLTDVVQVTTCGSLGLCEHGPNMVVYPDGVWYGGLTPADVVEITASHLRDGVVVERLVRIDTAQLRAEILHNREKFQAARQSRERSGALPEDLLTTIRAFQESRVVLSALELDVFTAVGPGSTADEVASRVRADERATEMLLNALVAMRLLKKNAGTFTNTPLSSRYFVEGSRDDARAALMHTAHMWQRWSTLTDCVRAGTAVSFEEMAERGEEWTRAFISAMDRNAAERAPMVAAAAGAASVRRMLDVGGGSGAYSIAFARANPALASEIVDLPTVTPIAQTHIASAGLSGRVTTRAGDLRTVEFGTGYDMVLVSAICHMLGPDENRDLLKRCFKALEPRGKIIIQDFILGPDKTAPRTAALFALNMLVGTRQGTSYNSDEYTQWLRAAGFGEIRQVPLQGPTGLMIAVRPAA